MIISERNLSVAWGKAFLAVYDAVEVAPLVVVIDDYPGGEPIEVASIREALDEELKAQGQGSCHTVASTMFPKSMWNPEASRGELFDRYLTIYPHLRKMHKANRNGMYFQRLIAFGSDNNGAGGFNQLDHVLTTWEGGNHRRTALQAALLVLSQLGFSICLRKRTIRLSCLVGSVVGGGGSDGPGQVRSAVGAGTTGRTPASDSGWETPGPSHRQGPDSPQERRRLASAPSG